MKQLVLTPDRFAAWFNSVVPGAYRYITAQDIRDMSTCGLIGRYGYYGRADIEIVRAVLHYERIRLDREQQVNTVRVSKRCGDTLPDSDGVGRPKEYCSECEPFRCTECWRKWYNSKYLAKN